MSSTRQTYIRRVDFRSGDSTVKALRLIFLKDLPSPLARQGRI